MMGPAENGADVTILGITQSEANRAFFLFGPSVADLLMKANANAEATPPLSLEWPKRRMSRPLDPGCRCLR